MSEKRGDQRSPGREFVPRAGGQQGGPEAPAWIAEDVLAERQRADRLASETFVAKANVDRYEHILQEGPDQEKRRVVEALLNRERAILAAGLSLLCGGRLDQTRLVSIFEDLLEEAIWVTGADMGNVQLLDSTGLLRTIASRGFDAPFLAFFGVFQGGAHSPCSVALQQAARVIVPDIEQDPDLVGNPAGAIRRAAGMRSVQCTPIVGSDRKPLGVVSTHRHSVWAPSNDELRRLDEVVSAVVKAIEAA